MKRVVWLFFVLLVGCNVTPKSPATLTPAEYPLTIMTYNIHVGKGMDGIVSLERIADEIKKTSCDLAGIQEVDRFTRRSPMDQPAILAKLMGYNVAYSKNLDYQGGEYGIAILSSLPIVEKRSLHYSVMGQKESRGALAVKIRLPASGKPLWFVTTHLGTDDSGAEQLQQVKELLEWLRRLGMGSVIVAGDFNQTPDSAAICLLRSEFVDLFIDSGEGNGATFDALKPKERIDYLFVRKMDFARLLSIRVPETNASDHRPVVARVLLKK
jgi:endonuclease/exonuclease/phosphatase family metal-dependent hydrolase